MRIDQQAKGTRILFREDAELYRDILNRLSYHFKINGFNEVILPCVEPQSLYENKAGPEILSQMYTFEDKGGRPLCLRPEGTATIQELNKKLGGQKDVQIFYETKCWRYEKPQAGRYREFTQFGVEWLNPRDVNEAKQTLKDLSKSFLDDCNLRYDWNDDVPRGLAYYNDGNGFEITIDTLGAQKQVMGGGSYEGGIGLAFGVDRLMLALSIK